MGTANRDMFSLRPTILVFQANSRQLLVEVFFARFDVDAVVTGPMRFVLDGAGCGWSPLKPAVGWKPISFCWRGPGAFRCKFQFNVSFTYCRLGCWWCFSTAIRR